MLVTKVLLNIRKSIKIQPSHLSPTQLRPNLGFSDIWKHLPCHPRALGHTIAHKATKDSGMQIKMLKANGKTNIWLQELLRSISATSTTC